MSLAVRKDAADIERIARRLEPELAAAFRAAVAEVRDALDIGRLADLIEAGDLDAVAAAIDLFPSPDEVRRILTDAATQAAQASGFRLDFTVVNAQAVQWATDHAADLVTLIDDETRAAIRDVIVRGQRDRLNVRDQAKEIRMLVGLTARHAQAVDRMFRGFDDPAFGLRQSQRYADRLLRFRAEMIARTETMRAANQGTQIAWDQAAADGLIDPGVRKVWIVTTDDRLCPQCAPMAGKTVAAVGGEFVSDTVATSFQGSSIAETRPANEVTVEVPPLHPQCRCTVALDFDI